MLPISKAKGDETLYLPSYVLFKRSGLGLGAVRLIARKFTKILTKHWKIKSIL